MALLGKIECRKRKVSHAFKRDQIAFLESVSVIGEKLEQSAHLATLPQQRQHHDRGDAERPASFKVHARIGFCIVATKQLAACDAFASQPGPYLQPGTDRGRAGTGAGAADHLTRLRQGERGSSGARDVLGALDQKLKCGVKLRFFQAAA